MEMSHYIRIMDLINQNKLGSNFVRPIEPINRLTTLKKIEKLLARKVILSGGTLGLNTLCRSCSNHTTLVGLLYPGGDKSEKVYTGYKVQPTKGLNLLKESECRASVQIVLCIFFLYINNIQKYYSDSFCVLFPLLLCLHQQ